MSSCIEFEEDSSAAVETSLKNLVSYLRLF